MIAGLAIGTPTALLGSIFYIVHSIIVSAALFMAAGMITRAGGGSEIENLAGLYKGAPFLSILFLLVGLSLAGVPPFAGFWPKVYLVQAGLETGSYALVAGVLVAGFLTLLVVGRTFALVFWRAAPDGASLGISGSGLALKGSLAVLAFLTLGLGLYAAPVTDASLRAADELLAPGAYIETVLGGLNSTGDAP